MAGMSPLSPSTPSAASSSSKSIQRRKLRQPERPASFHGRPMAAMAAEGEKMLRPKTHPDLRSKKMWAGSNGGVVLSEHRRSPAKVLVNVTVQRSLGPVQVMAPAEWTVRELISAAVKQYVKEGMRPPLPTTDPSAFTLHYSQFSLQGLGPEEKLIELGSRNFFVCHKSGTTPSKDQEQKATFSPSARPSSSTSCSNEARKESRIASPLLRIFDFLLM